MVVDTLFEGQVVHVACGVGIADQGDTGGAGPILQGGQPGNESLQGPRRSFEAGPLPDREDALLRSSMTIRTQDH